LEGSKNLPLLKLLDFSKRKQKNKKKLKKKAGKENARRKRKRRKQNTFFGGIFFGGFRVYVSEDPLSPQKLKKGPFEGTQDQKATRK
jgi:hypothetical protein